MRMLRLKQSLGLTLGAVVFGFGLVVIQAAWSEPLSSAPTCTSGNPGCDAPLYTESDPQVGTLTADKWCTSNGTAVNCTSDAPSGSQWTTNGSNIGYTAGNVAVGTTSTAWPMEIVTSNGWSGLTIHEQSNNDNGAVVNVYKERGTSSASANDWAGGMQYNIKDSAGNFQNIAAIHGQTTNVTDGSETGQLHFFTRNGATWGDRMIIDQSGNVGIGTSDPTYLLTVAGSGNSANMFSMGYFVDNNAASGNVYGIGINKRGYGTIAMGINKDSVTGSIPANYPFITTYAASQGMTLGRGASNNLPSTADIYIAGTSGNVGVGTTSPGTYKMNINGTGYLGASAWTYSSDRTLKENIEYFKDTLASSLDKIMALKPTKFDYIDGEKNQLGFIAQDVEEVIPEAVSVVNGTGGLLGLKTDFIIPHLVKAVQEIKTNEIDDLRLENEQLAADNANMKNELCAKDPTYSWCE